MRAVLASAAAVSLLLAACSSAEPQPSAPSGNDEKANASSPVETVLTPAQACPAPYSTRAPSAGYNDGFQAGGQSRKFQLLLPPASFTGPRPVLFAFHGTSETGSRFTSRAKLADFANRGFLVIAPDAVGNGSIWPVWDAMHTPGSEVAANPDVALFDKLLECHSAHFSIDRSRIFATGHSAGGIFTNHLLRRRSNVLAGGIPASGVFDLTSGGTNDLEPMITIVTWGGDNDSYTGSTSSGVSTSGFSFVEQASLASKYYKAQSDVLHVRCRGNDLGHAWLPLNDWFIDVLLAHPKGTTSLNLPPLPAGARAACSKDVYDVPALPQMSCPSSSRPGCQAACQLLADCAVENRTVGPSLQNELSAIGFTQTSCGGCVQRCQAGATQSDDPEVLSCLQQKQAVAQCKGGIEGASPLYAGINECCNGQRNSGLCTQLCTAINRNQSARPLFPTCAQF